jgi:hypothetical protein
MGNNGELKNKYCVCVNSYRLLSAAHFVCSNWIGCPICFFVSKEANGAYFYSFPSRCLESASGIVHGGMKDEGIIFRAVDAK